MKGETRLINGDRWTIVDVAPAAPLAEMVAAILEEEGFVVMTRGVDRVDDAFSHLGAVSAGTTVVLVPETDSERALALIAETVTDYEGDDLDEILAEMGNGASAEDLEALGIDLETIEEDEDDEP
ncbi:MAG TPA: DUF2007 domain-containing protein [Trueperaceae bacterium]